MILMMVKKKNKLDKFTTGVTIAGIGITTLLIRCVEKLSGDNFNPETFIFVCIVVGGTWALLNKDG